MLHIVLMFQTCFLVWNIIPRGPSEVIPKLLSHSDFGPVHTYLFSISVVKTKSSLSKIFSDPVVYSILEVIFFVFRTCTILKTIENATLCRTLWGFVQKDNDTSESIFDHFGQCGRKANFDCFQMVRFQLFLPSKHKR